jgi:uncharacterized protein HemX
MIELGTVLTALGLAAGGVVWGVRQEGRINANAQAMESLVKSVDERHAETNKKLDKLDTKLEDLSLFIVREARRNGSADSR